MAKFFIDESDINAFKRRWEFAFVHVHIQVLDGWSLFLFCFVLKSVNSLWIDRLKFSNYHFLISDYSQAPRRHLHVLICSPNNSLRWRYHWLHFTVMKIKAQRKCRSYPTSHRKSTAENVNCSHLIPVPCGLYHSVLPESKTITDTQAPSGLGSMAREGKQ